jgi:hypothetical protein
MGEMEHLPLHQGVQWSSASRPRGGCGIFLPVDTTLMGDTYMTVAWHFLMRLPYCDKEFC